MKLEGKLPLKRDGQPKSQTRMTLFWLSTDQSIKPLEEYTLTKFLQKVITFSDNFKKEKIMSINGCEIYIVANFNLYFEYVNDIFIGAKFSHQ